jgi:mono/diheme cytochrome c family protein
MTKKLFFLAALFAAIFSAPKSIQAADTAAAQLKDVRAILIKSCLECHGPEASEGNIRFDTLSSLTAEARLELLNKSQEQLYFGTMPPAEAAQPTPAERKVLADWVRGELQKSNAPLIEEKLRYPDYGNAVDHKKLFSGEVKEQASTPSRRWLVSPQIFNERVLDIFTLEGNERKNMRTQGFYGVTNPIVLPEKSCVRDYAINVLDGGHLLVMLTNAEWISQKQIRAARVKNGELKADEFDNPKDRWYPKTTPQALEKIILKKAKPSDDELLQAIQTQFDCVLQRKANDAEQKKYLALTRTAVDLAGNTEGLRQMLIAVLLDSEFLYRLEFGAGQADAHGRKMLSPREGAYAIAYALGDRGPDPALIKAAEEGRLNNKADYQREVQRLLADKNYFQGQIDKSINDSEVTSHPRVIRFFREFFGYPNATKVFKDNTRFANYLNPGRGSSGTPGRLVREADMLVDWIMRQDKNVFEELLTTDQYFVYHNISNEQGSQIIADWKKLYEALKDIDWQKNPEQALAEHQELMKKYKIVPAASDRHANTLPRVMEHWNYTFGRGNTPYTTFPWAHGNTFRYSQIYGLPITPGTKGQPGDNTFQYGGDDNLNYPIVQPFKLENHKGILTHPAWLIAHSSNFFTDPIRRGRWIQEKLLAGRVPDVPITVDAKVPEDPHRTFRERVESVTGKAQTACWKCHQHMNPLGYAFERFDDFGRDRIEESLENPENLVSKGNGRNTIDRYKTKPVNTEGYLSGTGDAKLDGPVKDALEMIDRLGTSERVRQSIIRHAFRFYMGRNETLSDSQTLIAADKAYLASGGSFKAVIVSLLTSDSFMYRN